MAHHMVAQIHRHKARELQKTRIYPPSRPFIIRRDGRNDILDEPFMRAACGVVVDRRRRFAGVNRTAHHRQGAWPQRMVLRAHHRSSSISRDGRLTHRQHMGTASASIGADEFKPFDEIIDVGFKIETAAGQRHIARIFPIGDIDIMRCHHALDRAAQQRREMAGHRRANEQPRLRAAAFIDEPLQLAKGLTRQILFLNRHRLAIDSHIIQSECRLSARQNRMRENIQCRRRDGCETAHTKWPGEILEYICLRLCNFSRTC